MADEAGLMRFGPSNESAGAGRMKFGANSDQKAGHKRPRQNDAKQKSGGRDRSAGPRDEPTKPIKHDFDKYKRGQKADIRHVDDKKYHRETKQKESGFREATESAARAEILLTENAGYLEAEGPIEKTYKFKQSAIASAVDINVAKNGAELSLSDYGPYKLNYTRNGRHMLLGGAKGHIAVVDWNKFSVKAEFNVREPVHDVTFLHNNQLFAVAQKKYAYIYDHTGAEVHVLKNHIEPLALDFLPYHFLLASIGTAGWLKYQDVSTGNLVAEHRTKLGSCSVLRQNPWNAVMCAGHGNGSVTMWTPNMSTPVVKLVSHKGPVTAMAIDGGGRYMVTAGLDSRVKVWDIRRFTPVHDYFSVVPAHALDISQKGMVGVGFGSHVQIWGKEFGLEGIKGGGSASLLDPLHIAKGAGASDASASAAVSVFGSNKRQVFDDDDEDDDGDDGRIVVDGYLSNLAANAAAIGAVKAKSPYLRHELPAKTVVSLRFRPYDDICAIGHSGGLSSIIVPGAGEPNYDSLEADPFQAKKARQEAEVHQLLDKLPSTAITLDPNDVGAVDRAAQAVRDKEKREAENARKSAAAAALSGPGSKAAIAGDTERKKKRRGINKALKKQSNIITEQRLALLEKLQEEKDERAKEDEKKKKELAKKLKAGSAGAAGDHHDHEEHDADGRPKSALSRFFSNKKDGLR